MYSKSKSEFQCNSQKQPGLVLAAEHLVLKPIRVIEVVAKGIFEN